MEFSNKEIFDGTHIPKNDIFDGLHKHLTAHFEIELPKKAIFDGTHISKKEI
jgi:hypothetical protein